MGSRAWVTLTFLAACVLGQDARPLVVSGIVRDATTGQPIPEVLVTLTAGRGIKFPPDPTPFNSHTGSDGRFSIAVSLAGPYVLYATADGYIAGSDLPRFLGVRSSSVQDIKLLRPADIAGVIVDDTSRKPLAGITVQPVSIRYDGGKRVLWPINKPAVTGKDGAFHCRALRPGPYLLEFTSAADEERIEIQPFAAGKEPAPRSIYCRMRWPADYDDGQTMVLNPGDDLRIPDIRLAKAPVYAIWGALKDPSCDASDRFRLSLTQQFGTAFLGRASVEASCGAHFIVSNLAPGSYQISAVPVREHASLPKAAWEHIEITNRGFKLDLLPVSALRVRGQLKLPDQFPDGQHLSMQLEPLQGGSFSTGPIVPGPDGSFQAFAMAGRTYRVGVLGLRPPYYVPPMKYTPADVGAESLTVVVADDSGTLSGRVAENDSAFIGAMVVAVSWPANASPDFPPCRSAESGEDGTFALAALPPGEYRVMAVPKDAWEFELQRPGRLACLTASVKSTTVRPRASVTAALELIRLPLQ